MSKTRVPAYGKRVFVGLTLCLLSVCGADPGGRLEKSLAAKQPAELVYVLDSNDMRGNSQVLVVDPKANIIVRRISAGYAPDIALSSDSARLYVSSVIDRKGRLATYDTSSGSLLQTVDSRDVGIPTTALYRSHMTFSNDGRWLYIFKYNFRDDLYFIDTFDVDQGAFLSEVIPLPRCLNAIITPSNADKRKLSVMCTSTNDVRFFDVSEKGKGTLTSALPLRLRGRTSRYGLSVGFTSFIATRTGDKAILDDGSIFEIDRVLRKITRLGVIDEASRRGNENKSPALTADNADWMGGKWLPFGAAVVSRGGDEIYLGLGQLGDFRRSDWTFSSVGKFDGTTLTRLGVIETRHRLYAIAVNRQGDRLFGVDPVNKRLVILDAVNGSEVAVIDQIGKTPNQVLVGF